MLKPDGTRPAPGERTSEANKTRSILAYRRFHYLKLALLTAAAAIGVFAVTAWQGGVQNGGTPVGLGLGIASGALILWLMWFGIRKRRYGGGAPAEDWLSAHVYMGMALIVLATLHSDFQFGWNAPTAAYALMLIVIASGVAGTAIYLRVPALMTRNQGGMTLEQMLREISGLDAECRQVALPLGDEVNHLVLIAGERTQVGGGVRKLLSGEDPDCPTEAASLGVRYLAMLASPDQQQGFAALAALLARKCEVLARARRDVRYKALLEVWLYAHVPLSFALIGALIAHLAAVLIQG